MIHRGISQQHKIIPRVRAGPAGFLAGAELFLLTFFMPRIVLCVESGRRVCGTGEESGERKPGQQGRERSFVERFPRTAALAGSVAVSGHRHPEQLYLRPLLLPILLLFFS